MLWLLIGIVGCADARTIGMKGPAVDGAIAHEVQPSPQLPAQTRTRTMRFGSSSDSWQPSSRRLIQVWLSNRHRTQLTKLTRKKSPNSLRHIRQQYQSLAPTTNTSGCKRPRK